MIHPTRSLLTAVAIATCLTPAAACGSSDAAIEGGIRVEQATIDWPANPSVAAVRMVVHNDGPEADALVGVTSPIARSATVHRSATDGEGRASMDMVAGLAIPARSKVSFEPGGLHVMLTGITDDVQVGDDVEVALTFEQAGEIVVEAEVVEPGSIDPDGAAGSRREPAGDHEHQ